ncbi:hypothetical protein WJX79_001194 [Trebouxia sp. C0005]
MVVDDSLKQSTAAVRCSLQQPGNSKGNHERPQKWHRLSTDPLTVTPRLADKKPISVTTGDARATFSLRYDEKDSRAGVQLSTCVETQATKCVLQQKRKLMKRELQLIRKANKEGELEKAMLDREVTAESRALLHASHHDVSLQQCQVVAG